MSNIDKLALRKKLNRRLNDAFGFQRTSGGKHTTISLSIDECKSVLVALDELEAAEKRIAELEAVKFKLSDSKLLSLAKDIVDNLVDTGASEPGYTQQYIDWTCKRIRAAAAGKGEAS